MFMFLFLFFSVLLLRSFFRLKELFQVKNGVTMSLLFLKMPKIWIGRTTVNGEKKEDGLTLFCAWQNLLIHCYNQYQNHRNHTFHWKANVIKTEHSLFRWTLWVLTQIYSKTRVYWNCLSQNKWKFLQRQPIPTHYLPEMLRLILKESFFHFNGKHYLQNHGTAMGTKTANLILLPIFSWHMLKQQL